MPGGMNGREMADQGRLRRPDLKVLFITGYADHDAIGDNELAPGMTVLLKPFPLQELVERVGHLISIGV
jgi:CheY-like chemotaxis protein